MLMRRKGFALTAPGTGSLPRLVLLALCFAGGVFFGQVQAGRVPEDVGEQLGAYLRDYVRLERTASPDAVLPALALYFRYPLLAFLLGFSAVGVVLLPCLTVVFGFFLSFSVCCFTAAFGADGLLVALAVLGWRCLVTLPCYFLLAVPGWGLAAGLAAVSFGRGQRPPPAGRAWWRRAALCGAVLLAGVCVELALPPALLRLALGHLTL